MYLNLRKEDYSDR